VIKGFRRELAAVFSHSCFVRRLWRPDMPLDEGIALMKKGFKEINERFLVGGATFTLKVSETES
jgi:hypothetical protein